MLSRVADALFWMSRYLERAEQMARLLEISFHLELDLHGVLSGPYEMQWSALLKILQQPAAVPNPDGLSMQSAICRWLAYGQDNFGSIMSCVNRSRNNARSVRGSISSEMWRELNKLYWQLSDPEFRNQVADSPHDFCQAVQIGSQLFQGVCDASLMHDEGWQFIQLGRYIERAEKTLCILDVKYHILQELSDPTDLPLTTLQWAAVLKSCQAYEAYQRFYIGRVEPERVIDFILMNPDFPHSVQFCLEQADRALRMVGLGSGSRRRDKARRILGRLIADLEFGETDQMLHSELHDFLQSAIARLGEACVAVQEQYTPQY